MSSFTDEKLKLLVYRKTLQATLYPISQTFPHDFRPWTATFRSDSTSTCYECDALMWSLSRTQPELRQCTGCGVKCHKRCADFIVCDCLRRQQDVEVGLSDHVEDDSMLSVKMKVQVKNGLRNKAQLYELIRQVFAVDNKVHKAEMNAAKQRIIYGMDRSTKIAIIVMSAQGFNVNDQTEPSNHYVTVQLGKTIKRTKMASQSPESPSWNETFHFECPNSTDRVKVRVWRQDSDIMSRLRRKFAQLCRKDELQSENFVGYTFIESLSLSGDMDAWHNLKKRPPLSSWPSWTESGAIHLLIHVETEGEKNSPPYHLQYTCLHETIFHYQTEQNQGQPNLPRVWGDDAWKTYFDTYFDVTAQEIVDEFAMRYGIEPIFQARTHVHCLSTKYLCPGVPTVLSTLLANINAFYARPLNRPLLSAGNHLSTSNFGMEKYVKIVDTLHDNLRHVLQNYRNNFPALIPARLRDLKSTVDLLTCICYFRMKVQELAISLIPRSAHVLRECLTLCLETTYKMLFQDCYDLYEVEFPPGYAGADGSVTKEMKEPQLDNLNFWHKLLALIETRVNEDLSYYWPTMNQFPQELNTGKLSIGTFWSCFAPDLEKALDGHAGIPHQNGLCNSDDYMSLHLEVKLFCERYLFKGQSPAYESWFEPFRRQS